MAVLRGLCLSLLYSSSVTGSRDGDSLLAISHCYKFYQTIKHNKLVASSLEQKLEIGKYLIKQQILVASNAYLNLPPFHILDN